MHKSNGQINSPNQLDNIVGVITLNILLTSPELPFMICFIVIVVFPTNNVVKRYFKLSYHTHIKQTLHGGLEGEQKVNAHFIFRHKTGFHMTHNMTKLSVYVIEFLC